MRRYEPLERHLAARPEDTVSLSYSEIERLLGQPLPPSARSSIKHQWWANDKTHSQAKAWMKIGRRAKLDARNDIVTFYRNGGDSGGPSPVPSPDPAETHLSRTALQPAAIRLIEDYMDEHRVDFAHAMAELLNQAALRHRRESLDWFARHTTPSATPSSELIRMDRDGR